MDTPNSKIFGEKPGLDARSVQFLTNALTKNNLPGFDYLEFKESLQKLRSMHMDESTAYKSAFATASIVGLTKDKLLDTANHYKGVLSSEKGQFDQALRKRIDTKVNGRKQEAEQLQTQIQQWRQQIEQLEAQIQHAEETIANTDEQIQRETDKINTTRERFEATFTAIVREIEGDIQNVKNYL